MVWCGQGRARSPAVSTGAPLVRSVGIVGIVDDGTWVATVDGGGDGAAGPRSEPGATTGPSRGPVGCVLGGVGLLCGIAGGTLLGSVVDRSTSAQNWSMDWPTAPAEAARFVAATDAPGGWVRAPNAVHNPWRASAVASGPTAAAGTEVTPLARSDSASRSTTVSRPSAAVGTWPLS